jgi:L-fuculose-phosphate aldolase
MTWKPGLHTSAIHHGAQNSDFYTQFSIELADYGRLLHQRSYVSGTNGNLSVRLGPEHVLISAAGVGKGFMQPKDFVLVTLDGKKIRGRSRPSSEIGMHLTIYKMRPDIAAIVHAHPPIATSLACARLDITKPVYSELLLTLGEIPLAPYATPGTDQLSRVLEPFIPGHDAILLQNHGAVAYSSTLRQAYLNMETVEHCAKIALITRLLRRSALLSNDEVRRLHLARLKKK